jgi:hypothetical protein
MDIPVKSSIERPRNRSQSSLLFIALACLALAPLVHAVVPAPDGGYPGGNTAEGENALFSLTSGTYNTATGYVALYSNTTGMANIATGGYALYHNTTGNFNTASGHGALYWNGIGYSNTATGV